MQRSFTDQLGRTIRIDFPPERIVSLVPSQTELLHYLGLEQETVGITKFCTHPEKWYRTKARIGGTKQIRQEDILALCPGLVIGNKEENDKGQIEALSRHLPVWLSDVRAFEQALDMIRKIGALTGKEEKSKELAASLETRFDSLSGELAGRPRLRAAYFIWRKPYMVAGKDTFIQHMLERAGFENVFAHLKRYPEISLEELAAARPDVALLSSEPYPFSEKHREDFRRACPVATVKLVDGAMFSWYGSRLLQAPDYFRKLRRALAEAHHTQ